MADDVAKTSLVFDASGAQKGAQEFARAGEQIIAALRAVQAEAEKAAKATGQAEVDKAAARANGAKKAVEAAATEAKAAATAGDAVVTATARKLKSMDSQITALDRYAKMFDPFLAAAERAARQLENVMDIAAKTTGAVQQRAQGLGSEAADRAAQATLNQAAGFDINRTVGQFQQRFDPDTTNAKEMVAQQQQLNKLLEVGAINARTYADWTAKLAASYDTAAQAAQRQKEALVELIDTTRRQQEATEKAFQAQRLFNVGFAPGLQNQVGTIGGKAVFDQDTKSAAASAQVFVEDAKATEEANVELATMAERVEQLRAKFDPVTASALAMTKEIADLNEAQRLGISIAGGYEAAYQKIVERYDEGAQAAKRAAEAQREVTDAARAAQNTLNAQQAFNEQLGVQQSSGTVGGRSFSGVKSAQESAQVFEQEMADQKEADAALGAIGERAAELAAKFDPATASARAMTAELAELNEAQKLGVEIAGGYQAAWDAIVAKYDLGAQAAKRAADAQRVLIELGRQEQDQAKAAAAQQAFNAQLGVKQPQGTVGGRPVFAEDPKSATDSGRVFQEQFDAEEKVRVERQQLINQFDPLTAAAQRYAEAIGKIDQAEQLNVIDAKRATELRNTESTSYGRAATETAAATKYMSNFRDSAFGARFAAQQLGVQTIQFFSSLQAGQPFLQAFIGQAHQVVDVAVVTGTGFKTLTTAVSGWISSLAGWVTRNPIVAGAIAATTAILALTAVAESANRRLQALRNVLSAQRPDDYMKAAGDSEIASRRLAATTDLSTKQARDAVSALYSDPGFKGTPEQAVAIGAAFEKLSKAAGDTAPNFQRLREAVKDPAAGMKQLVDQFRSLDPELVHQAERMQRSGDSAGAFDLVLKTVRETTKNVAQTPLAAALTHLGEAFSGVTVVAEKFTHIIGNLFVTIAAGAIEGIARLADFVGKIGSLVGHAASAIRSGIGSLVPERPSAGPLTAGEFDVPGAAPPQLAARQAAAQSAVAGATAGTASESGRVNTAQDVARAADAAAGRLQILSERLKELRADQIALSAQFEAAQKTGNPEQIEKYGNAVKALQGQIYDAIGPQEQMARSMEQTARVAQALTEGDQKVIAAQEQLNELNAKHPDTATAANDARIMNAVLKEQDGEFGKLSDEIARQIDAQDKLAAAYGKSYAAAEQQIAANLGLTESLKLYKAGIDRQIAAEKDLARMHEILTTKAQQTAAAQRDAAGRDTLIYQKEQIDTLGKEELARERILNHLKTELELKKEFAAAPEKIPGLLEQSDIEFAQQQAIQAIMSINLVSDALKRLEATRADIAKRRAAAQSAGNAPAVQELTEKDKALQGQIYSTVGAQEQMVRGMEQSARVAQALTEGDQKLLQVREQLAELDRQHPDTASAANEARAISAALAEQDGQFKRLKFDADQQVAAQGRLAAAYGDGYAAVGRATAANQALLESMRLFPLDSAKQAAAFQELTVKYQALATATQQVQAAQMAAQNRDTITALNAETASLGQDSLERERYLNHIRTEIELKRQLPMLSEAARKALLAENDAIFAQQQALQVHQAAINEIAGSVAQSFDTIGNAITQAFVDGNAAAVNWQNVMKSVVTQVIQQFMKLAILNPALNALFPSSTHRPTLEDAFTTPKPIQANTDKTLSAITGAGGLPIDPLTGAMRVVSVGAAGPLLGTGTGAAVVQQPLAAVTSAASSLPGAAIPDRSQLDLVTVQSPSGAKFTVDRSTEQAFKGFLGDLEGTGYKVNPGESGGYNPRNIAGTSTPSLHAFGRAIDINSQENPQGASGAQNLPPDVAAMAQKWGLTWGGNWSGSTRDPMHFEVPLSGSAGVATAANDNARAAAARTQLASLPQGLGGRGAGFGGLPIDPALNAMRVVVIGGAGIAPEPKSETVAANAATSAVTGRAPSPSATGVSTASQIPEGLVDQTVSAAAATGQGTASEAVKVAGAAGETITAAKTATDLNTAITDNTDALDAVEKDLVAQTTKSAAAASTGGGGVLGTVTGALGVAGGATGQGTIDPATGAMRVVVVGGGGLAGAAAASGTGISDAAVAAAKAAEGDSKQADSSTKAASSAGSEGGLFNWLRRLFGGGSSSSSRSSGGSSAPQSESSSGFLGNALSSVGKFVGEFPKGVLDPIFGKGFYQGGGLIGQWMNGTDPITGFGNLFSGSDYDGMAAGSGLDALSADAAGIAGGGIGGTASIVHTGGLIGTDQLQQHAAPVDPRVFNQAARYHSGLNSDEFAAILQHGERVLTASQNTRLEQMVPGIANENRQMQDMLTSPMPNAGGSGAAALSGAMSAMQRAQSAANQNPQSGDVTNNNGHTFNVNVSGPMTGDESRRTGYQIATAANSRLQRASQRSATR